MYYQAQSEGYKDKVDSLLAKLLHSEELHEKLHTEYKNTKAKMNILAKEVETIPILKAQVKEKNHL